MKIMIIDDVRMNILALQRAIGAVGAVEGFQDPVVALGKLRTAYQQGDPYDLLFLDIMMPGVNGLDLLDVIVEMGKTLPGEKKTKIVMVTSAGERDIIVRAIRSGAAAYILKPLQPQRIQEEIRRLTGTAPRETGVKGEGGAAAA